jgi:hypothetical protein
MKARTSVQCIPFFTPTMILDLKGVGITRLRGLDWLSESPPASQVNCAEKKPQPFCGKKSSAHENFASVAPQNESLQQSPRPLSSPSPSLSCKWYCQLSLYVLI